MDPCELEHFEDELRALQCRIEQSVRFFFQNQRDLLLENFRSTNDLRTSMENTMISGTGNSKNSWQIYLVEEPVAFNVVHFLYIAFLFWLMFSVFYIIRKYNDLRRVIPRNSRYIRYEQINDLPLTNNIENDRRNIENEPNNDNDEETNGQGNENQPINELPLTPINDNEEEINHPDNALQLNNEFHRQPYNALVEETNSGQEIDINNTINKLRKEMANSFKNVLNKFEQWKPVMEGKTDITERGNNANEETTKKDIVENHSEPLSSDNTEIETSDQRKDAANQTEDEVKSEKIEKNPVNGLTNGHRKESSSSSCNEVTTTKNPSVVANNENVKIVKENKTIVITSENPSKNKNYDSKSQESSILPSEVKINNLPKSQNVITTIASVHHTGDEVVNTKDNGKNDLVQRDSKDGLTTSDEENSKDLLSEVASNEDAKETIENNIEINATEKLSNNKNDSIKQVECNLDNGKKVEIIEEPKTLPSENKTKVFSTPLNVITVETLRKLLLKLEEILKTEGEEKNDLIEKDSEDDLANQGEESRTLPSKNKTTIFSKPQNVITLEILQKLFLKLHEDDTDEGLKTEDEEKNDLTENDSEDDLTNQGDSKDSSATVSNNENMKNAIENINEASATEKNCGNKNIGVKGDDSNLEKDKKANVVEEIKPLPSENKASYFLKSQNKIDTDEVVKTKHEKKEKPVQKVLTDAVVNEEQEKPEGFSSGATRNKDVKLSEENKKGENTTEKSILGKNNEAGDIDVSETLLSENKTSNSPKSQNITISKSSDSHTDEVVGTKDEENNSEDLGNALKNKIKANTTEKLDGDKIEDNKETEVTPLEKESDIDNTEKSKALPSENKTSNSPKSQNVIETPDSHTDEVIKPQEEEKKESIEKHLKDGSVKDDQEMLTSSATEKPGENKNDGNIEEKNRTEISNSEESATLSSENKSSNSPKSQNITETLNSHTDEVVKTEDIEKEVSMKEQVEGGLVNGNQEMSTSSATEKLSGNKNDDSEEDDGAVQKESKVGIIEEFKTLPSENESSSSPKTQNVSETENFDHQTDEVVKIQDVKDNSLEKNLKDGLTSEDPKLENSPENNVETNITKNASGNKTDESKENLGDAEIVPNADIIEELIILQPEGVISNSSESQIITTAETPDLHKDEVLKTEDEETKESNEKDLINKDQEEPESISLGVADNNIEASETEKINEKKNDDNLENKDSLQHVTEANMIEESKRVPSETSTSEHQEEKIVKSENVKEDLKTVAEKIEINAADEENKKIQSEDSKETLSNEDKISIENKTGDAIEKECDLGSVNESEIGDISNSQSEIAIKSTNLDEIQIVIIQNEVIKTEDEETKEPTEKDLMNKGQEESESTSSGVVDNNIEASETEKVTEKKDDDNMENKDSIQHATDADMIEESKRLPFEASTSEHQEEKIVNGENVEEAFKKVEEKIEMNAADEENKNIQSEDSKKAVSNEDKISNENKTGDAIEKESDLGPVNETVNVDESLILSCENKIGDISNSQSEIAVKSSNLEETQIVITLNEVIKTETEETKEPNEKDLMNKDQEESESTSLGVVDNNIEASETEKISERKNDDNLENKEKQHATDADMIEESKRLPSETSTSEHQEEKIVKSENIEDELKNVSEKIETNAADEENKKIQSEDSKEALSNEDNKSGDAIEKEYDSGPVNENKIGDISNSQSEIAIKSSNLEETEIVITQNVDEKIEISSNVVEVACEAIEANVLNENEIKDKKSEEQNAEAASGIENNSSQEDTFDMNDKNPSSSGSDEEDQATSSTPHNSSSGNDQLLGGQRKNRKKKKGRKSKHKRH